MDGQRFDELVRRVLGAGSRRGILRSALSSLTAPGLAALGLSSTHNVEAKNKNKKRKRRRKKKRKDKKKQPPPPPPLVCAGLQESCVDCTCPAGSICGDNFCDDPPVCCADEGGACGEEDCNCCHRCAGCKDDGLCHCNGPICNGVCKCECCDDDDCGAGQTCDPDGVCVCPAGIVCGTDCCELGSEVCHYEPDLAQCEAGGCPAYPFCTQEDTFYECGVGCPCITSIEGVSSCTDMVGISCLECTTDDECVADLGPGAFCLQGGEFCEGFCPNPNQNFCVSGGCSGLSDSQSDFGAARGRGVAARGWNLKSAKQSRKKRGGR